MFGISLAIIVIIGRDSACRIGVGFLSRRRMCIGGAVFVHLVLLIGWSTESVLVGTEFSSCSLATVNSGTTSSSGASIDWLLDCEHHEG